MRGEAPFDELDRIIGARARILRLKRGLSPSQAAAVCGTSVDEILAMEEGQVRINAAMILSMCSFYDAGAHCFYTGTFDKDGRRTDERLFIHLIKDSDLVD